MASCKKCGRTYGGLSAVGTCPECANPAPLAIPSTVLLDALVFRLHERARVFDGSSGTRNEAVKAAIEIVEECAAIAAEDVRRGERCGV